MAVKKSRDLVQCKECGLYFEVLPSHLRTHNISSYEYQSKYPGEPTINERLSSTLSKTASRNFSGPFSEDHTANLSLAALKAYERDPFLRERVGSGPRGKTWTLSEDQRRNASIAQTRAYEADPTLRYRGGRGAPRSGEYRRNLSKAALEAYKRDTTLKDRISISNKKRWEDPEFVKERLEAQRRSPNGPESTLLEMLEDRWPGRFKSNVKGAQQTLLLNWGYQGRDCPDIVRIDGFRQVLFSNGNYWHRFDDEAELIDNFSRQDINCIVTWADSWEDTVVDWPRIVREINKGEIQNAY